MSSIINQYYNNMNSTTWILDGVLILVVTACCFQGPQHCSSIPDKWMTEQRLVISCGDPLSVSGVKVLGIVFGFARTRTPTPLPFSQRNKTIL